jgi:hypothetical protein
MEGAGGLVNVSVVSISGSVSGQCQWQCQWSVAVTSGCSPARPPARPPARGSGVMEDWKNGWISRMMKSRELNTPLLQYSTPPPLSMTRTIPNGRRRPFYNRRPRNVARRRRSKARGANTIDKSRIFRCVPLRTFARGSSGKHGTEVALRRG